MKRSLAASAILLLAFASLLPAASAAKITLTDGRTFHDATIVSQTPRKVVIKHTHGLSGIEKTLLPTDLRAAYPFDEVAAREADRQAAEARARADAFHQAEAARSALIRLEREQTALLNAQIAAQEATARLAEAEAARIAAQRTEVVYEYVSFNRSYPRYIYTPHPADDCTPRWNEKPRNRHVHDDRQSRPDQKPSVNRPGPVQNSRNNSSARHTQTNTPRAPQIQPTPEETKTPKVAAAVVIRR
ncbi:hypothetical protein CMV30_09015 [Nibricoccus aquaticus]|uniref:Uncharacterized protein n=1 Tax=Nibricoccus aquaticus TaxID=2576891 RepID=A0A290QIA4_9BACT|nr:hypothetical protein [Nibricoccus aquaticus]ATC64081.1 hypothetical protein CMV30_09015 [Nibricoccus aquaticus]